MISTRASQMVMSQDIGAAFLTDKSLKINTPRGCKNTLQNKDFLVVLNKIDNIIKLLPTIEYEFRNLLTTKSVLNAEIQNYFSHLSHT